MVVAMGIFGMAGVAGLIVMSIGAANYVDLTALDPDTDFQLHSNACNIINVEVTTSQGTHQSGAQGSGTSSYCYKYYDITFSFQGQDWSDGDRTGCGASAPWTVGDTVDCWEWVGEGTVDRTYGVNSVCSTGASVCVVLENPESAIEGLTGGKCVLTTSTTLLSVVTADDYRALFVCGVMLPEFHLFYEHLLY